MKKKSDRVRAYLLIGLLLIFAIASVIGSYQIYQKRPGLAEAGTYPLLMSALMVISLIGAFFEMRKNFKKDQIEEEKGNTLLNALKAEFPAPTVFLGACILLYAVLFHFVGFYISSAVFLLVSMAGLYRGKKMLQTLLVTAGSLVAIYVIIEKIFNIPLP